MFLILKKCQNPSKEIFIYGSFFFMKDWIIETLKHNISELDFAVHQQNLKDNPN